MKKICWVIIGLGLSLNAHCQVLIGFKTGGHISRVQYEDVFDQGEFDVDLSGGLNAGGAITFPIVEPFSMHVELIYTHKRKKLNSSIQQTTSSARYHFMEMPILMRFQIDPQKGLYLSLGPNISYWLSGSGSLNNLQETGTPMDYKVVFNATTDPDQLSVLNSNRWQFGLIFGIGALLDMGEDRKLMVEGRLELGHSHLAGDPSATLISAGYEEDMRSKYQLISFNLGYFLPKHKKNERNRSHTYKAKRRN